MPKVTPPHRVENGTALKRCSKCKDWKPVGQYYKEKPKWDGLKSACKECEYARKRKYYAQNSEKILAKARRYQEENRERRAAKSRKYYEKNKEKLVAKSRKYYEKNKANIVAKSRKYYEKNKEKLVAKSRKYYEKNKEKIADYRCKYIEKNKEKIAAKAREYNEKNKVKISARRREYQRKNAEKISSYLRKYNEKNKEKLVAKRQRKEVKERINKRLRERRKEDPQFRLTNNMRNALKRSLQKAKTKKKQTSFKYFYCSPSFLFERIEKMRVERGLNEDFHVDHMLPLDSFDLSNPEQLKRAWHWSNLQAISPKENLRKSNKVIYDMRWSEKRDQWLIRNEQGKGPYRPTALFRSLLFV